MPPYLLYLTVTGHVEGTAIGVPTDPYKGLGQGLTYAVDADFCERILPQFSERDGSFFNFVDCKLLRAALNRAFNTWSDNHPAINFFDVTKLCEDSHGGAMGCPLAEVVIATDGSGNASGTLSGERAAFVRLYPTWEKVHSIAL